MKKNSIDFKDNIDKALHRFALDRENQTDSAETLLSAINLKKVSPTEKLFPKVFPGGVASSIAVSEYLREAKLRINVLGDQLITLDNEIQSACGDAWGTLNDTLTEVKQIEAAIQEEELKAEGKYQVVHYNAFVRPIDMGDVTSGGFDWKSEQPLGPGYELRVIPGAGLTLPCKSQQRVFIRQVSLLDEGTDAGDTSMPLIKSDPMDLIKPNTIFRYVIARKAYDETGRLYQYTESTCKILIQLGTIQLLNHLKLGIVAASPLFLKALEYINESGELVAIDTETLSIDGVLDIITEPVRTASLILTLVQYSAVEETFVSDSSLKDIELNKLLQGANWSVLASSVSDPIQARVYDFSMSDLSVEFVAYKHFGYFLSQKVNLVKPLSLSLSAVAEAIRISTSQHAYNSEYFLPDDTVLFESYLKLNMINNRNDKQIDMQFPVPSSTQNAQVELLPIQGQKGKACFFPDMFFNSMKKRVAKVVFIDSEAFVTLQSPHGIEQGIVYTDPVELWLDRSQGRNNFISTSWEAISDVRLVLSVDYPFDGGSFVTENDTPTGWMLRRNNTSPFNVYEEGSLLSLGDDYEYSLDAGETWLSELITYAQYAELSDLGLAGNFRIKILNPERSAFYWISYKRASKQYLHASKLITLVGSSVVLNKSIRRLSGTVQVLLILRTNSRVSQITSLIQNYKLKVREL